MSSWADDEVSRTWADDDFSRSWADDEVSRTWGDDEVSGTWGAPDVMWHADLPQVRISNSPNPRGLPSGGTPTRRGQTASWRDRTANVLTARSSLPGGPTNVVSPTASPVLALGGVSAGGLPLGGTPNVSSQTISAPGRAPNVLPARGSPRGRTLGVVPRGDSLVMPADPPRERPPINFGDAQSPCTRAPLSDSGQPQLPTASPTAQAAGTQNLDEAMALLKLSMSPDMEQEGDGRQQLVALAVEVLKRGRGRREEVGTLRAVESEVGGYCLICCEERADTVLMPCGHLVLCVSCCDRMEIKGRGARGRREVPCPICRTVVEDRVKIFRG